MLNTFIQIISSLVIFFSISLFLFQNPIFSFFSFILVILLSSFLMFSIQVEFLSLMIIIIYLGAVLILFLFLLMVVTTDKSYFKKNINKGLSLNSIFFFLILIKFFCLTLNMSMNNYFITINYILNKYLDHHNINYVYLVNSSSNELQNLGLFLYKLNYLYLIVVSIILLVALIGSISIIFDKK